MTVITGITTFLNKAKESLVQTCKELKQSIAKTKSVAQVPPLQNYRTDFSPRSSQSSNDSRSSLSEEEFPNDQEPVDCLGTPWPRA